MPAQRKSRKPRPVVDPARLMQRDSFSSVVGKLEELAQTRNTAYVSQDEVIEKLVPQINTALTNGHRLDEIFAVLQAEGVPLTRLLARDIRKRLNMPQPRQRRRPTLRAIQSAGPDAA